VTLVVDASAAVDYLLGFGAFERISERLAAPGETLHAPHLLDVEVAHALRRLSSHATITPTRAQEALEDYAALRVRRHSHLPLLSRIWELRANVSAFDAAYVALAEALDAPLITADAALARAPGHVAEVEVYR
jgi:predicted nucleic acid-binding protein